MLLLTILLVALGAGNFSSVSAQEAATSNSEVVRLQTSGNHQITYFKGNKAAALSITFDDGYAVHRTIAVPQLSARGLVGTFFVITGREDPSKWAQWQSAVAQGHEVAAHTVTHADLELLSQTSEGEMRAEMIDSQFAITQNVPGQACASFAYPFTSVNAAVLAASAEYFDAARVGQTPSKFLNHYQAGSDQYGSWSAIDFVRIASINGDSLGVSDQYLTDQFFNTAVTAAPIRHAWLSLHIHDIPDPTSFGHLLDYVQGKPEYWIDTFCNISRYMKERLNTTVQVVSETSLEIRLELDMSGSLPTQTYNFPLTVRSVVPASWSEVKVQQGTTVQTLTAISEASEKVIYYNAVPNGGEVVLTQNPVPVIGSLNPSSAGMGNPGFTLTVNGTDFVNGSVVRWNGADRTTSYVNSTQLTATILAGDIAAIGTANVTVFNPAPGGGSSGPLTFTINASTPPAAFGKSSPANGAVNQPLNPSLTWAASTGAVSYEYCYDTSNDNACTSWTSNGNSTSKALSGLTTSTTYYWQVRAVNAIGTTYADGSDTAYRTFTTVPNPPAAFGKTSPVNGAADQSTSLTLTWAASTGAVSYEYCYDTSNDNVCSGWTGNGNSTSKALSGLIAGSTYYWHVRALNSGGTTYANNSGTAFWSFTLSCYTLTKNVNPSGTGVVNANPAPNCNSGTQYSYGTTVTLTAAANPNYAFQVWSGDVSGSVNPLSVIMTANKTATATFASFSSALSAPSLRSPQSNLVTVDNTPTFLWTSVTGGQSYEIVFASDSGFASIVASRIVSGTSYTASPALGDGKYYWRVRAYNSSHQFGSWGASRILTVDTLGPAVPILSSPLNAATVKGTPVFKWQSSSTAVLYEFQYASDSVFNNIKYTSSRQSNTCSPSAMKTGSYYWRVRAKDAAGNWSLWSAPVTITITR